MAYSLEITYLRGFDVFHVDFSCSSVSNLLKSFDMLQPYRLKGHNQISRVNCKIFFLLRMLANKLTLFTGSYPGALRALPAQYVIFTCNYISLVKKTFQRNESEKKFLSHKLLPEIRKCD